MVKLVGKPEQLDILKLTKELSNDVCLDVRHASASQMDTIVNSLDDHHAVGSRFLCAEASTEEYVSMGVIEKRNKQKSLSLRAGVMGSPTLFVLSLGPGVVLRFQRTPTQTTTARVARGEAWWESD